MKSGVVFLLGGTLALAGCSGSSNGSGSVSPTSTVRPVALRATPMPTHFSAPTALPAAHTQKAPARVAAKESMPAHATAYQKGQFYLHQRNFSAAKAAFEAAITARDHVPESYAGIGTATIGLGQYSAALRAFEQASKIQPKNPGYVYYSAYAALYARQYHVAVTYATHYIALQPRAAAGYHLRFLAYGQLLQKQKQVTDARTIVRLAPKDPQGYNDLGIALTNDNKLAAGIRAFTQAINMRPRNPGYYVNRALAENLAGEPQKVLADLYKARSLTRDPQMIRNINMAIQHFKAAQTKGKHH